MDAAKKIILLLALVVACALPASALTPSAPENRVWEKITGTLETHQEASPQVPQSHQEEAGATAETVSECFLAAEEIGAVSLRDASGGLKGINTDVTADEFSANLQANGYSLKTTENGANILTNGQGSTYSIYTRTSTGQSGAQYFGPNGQSLKFNLGQ